MITKTRQKTAEMVLAELEVAYAKTQQEMDILEINKEFLKNAILSQMETLFPADESAKWVNPDTGGTLTRIFANRFKFDLAKFAVILPSKIFAKVTKSVVDSKAYIAAIETGIVDNDKMTAIGAVEQIRDIRLKHEGGK